ncbi:MAG: hypothetical protein M1821_007845 [Bathelium mastoideum]|nr:MAG: hypothetical protein M1821_007845 [Bathelium mastoideum]
MSRPQSASSSKTGASHARKPVGKPASASPLGPTLASLFVTNLRLLDFDTLPDWPNITPQVLSSSDVQQNAKHRIRCVEWALYRLFELWDPAGTKEKLQPFFPPLEPLQSLNLRAALFRSLNELKKNGILGRASVLRKTMLDECKGDKFEEVLVIFSTIVLKKELSKRESGQKKEGPNGRTIARKLGIASTLKDSEKKSLLPLAIAHRASLQQCLEKRQSQHQRFRKFAQQLSEKEDEINERNAKAKSLLQQPPSMEKADLENTVALLREHWLGHPEWIDVLLCGDTQHSSDRLLGQDFVKEIWPKVQIGQSLEAPSSEKGLWEDLQERVEQQQKRLRSWEKFQAFHVQDQKSSISERTKKEDLEETAENVPRFDKHEHLQLSKPQSGSPRKLQSSRAQNMLPNPLELRPNPVARYRKLLLSMQEDLNRASKTGSRRASQPTLQGPSQDLPEPPKVKETTAARSNDLGISTDYSSLTSEPNTEADAEDVKPSFETSPINSPIPQTIVSPAEEEPPAPSSNNPLPNSSLPPSSSPLQPSVRPTGYSNHHLSLAERTRRSVALASSSSEPPSLPQSSSPVPLALPSPRKNLPAAGQSSPSPTLDRRTSLLDRTRLSMANITAKPPTATSTTKPRRSTAAFSLGPPHSKHRKPGRPSHFPVNPFETPQKMRRYDGSSFDEKLGGEVGSDGEEKTPTEDLFSEEAEYASVFKSRPRVALSPTMSPMDSGLGSGASPLEGLGIGEGK